VSDGLIDVARGRLLYKPPESKDESEDGFILIGHVLDALDDFLKNREERQRMYDEFQKEQNLQPGDKLTPELKKALADKLASHIMAKAKEKQKSMLQNRRRSGQA